MVPYGTTFPPRWEACHTILRSLCSLTNRVPLPPRYRSGDKRKAPLWAGQAPYFARLAHPMQDVHRGRINCSMLSCRDTAPWLNIHSPTTKWGEGGGASHQRGAAFPRPPGRLLRFSIKGRLLSIHRRHYNPRPERPSNLRTLRTFGSEARQPSHRRCVQRRSRLEKYCLYSLYRVA